MRTFHSFCIRVHWCHSWPLLVMALMTGCGVQVAPPLNPPHPTVVYFCDYGLHSSLLLPSGNGQFVEYLYGDWNWAALAHTGWINALGAVFWSQQSTLGRRVITQLPDATMPRPTDGPKTEVPMTVNGDGCKSVIKELADRWENDRAKQPSTQQVHTDYWYVKDDRPYNWLHDCNRETADYLREMGCRVDGWPIWSNFTIVQPAR